MVDFSQYSASGVYIRTKGYHGKMHLTRRDTHGASLLAVVNYWILILSEGYIVDAQRFGTAQGAVAVIGKYSPTKHNMYAGVWSGGDPECKTGYQLHERPVPKPECPAPLVYARSYTFTRYSGAGPYSPTFRYILSHRSTGRAHR